MTYVFFVYGIRQCHHQGRLGCLLHGHGCAPNQAMVSTLGPIWIPIDI